MKNSKMVAAIALVVLMFASNAFASSVSGHITSVQVVTNTTAAVIGFDVAFTPACGTAGYYLVDITNDKGKAEYQLALSAFLAGKSVQASGAGSCGLNSNYETIKWIFMN